MDFNKAKNYTIIFLIALNIVLFICNYYSDLKYRLDYTSIEAIKSVLNKNDIFLEAPIPSKFTPMQQIYLEKSNYDVIELQKIFFKNEDITKTEEFESTIIESESGRLSIMGGIVSYERKKAIEGFELDENKALDLSSECINALKALGMSFEMDYVKKAENSLVISYIQKYLNFAIFDNYAVFIVREDGTFELTFSYSEPERLYGNENDICSADEALFVFSDEIRRIYSDGKITVELIDMGYSARGTSLENSSVITAVPYYRIFTKESFEPYYINAYTMKME